jgi:hypothetical protein
MTEDGPVTGRFLGTGAGGGAAGLWAGDGGRVHRLASEADLAVGDVVEGTLEPTDPLGVTWRLAAVTTRWRPTIEAVEDDPGTPAREAIEGAAVGQLERVPPEDGELHVLSVDPGRTDAAVEDILADETTRRIAARLGARRVEVRSETGLVAVRYRLTQRE